MHKHFVTFYSPGTFVAESSSKPIDQWDVDSALEMARGISERYGATPYGFRFSTRYRTDDDLDSKETATSNMYYLGGKVETIEEIRERADPSEKILLSNMESNDFERVIRNENSWAWTQPLKPEDVVLDFAAK